MIRTGVAPAGSPAALLTVRPVRSAEAHACLLDCVPVPHNARPAVPRAEGAMSGCHWHPFDGMGALLCVAGWVNTGASCLLPADTIYTQSYVADCPAGLPTDPLGILVRSYRWAELQYVL